MGGGRGVEVINSKGCSRMFVDSFSLINLRVGAQMPPASTSVSSFSSHQIVPLSNAPFSGLVICVTGLSKEARKQVMDATERLGGQYSAHLHPQCTHLVVQSSYGRKFAHALKHGRKNGLFIVTLGWFVDSVRRNVRLSESLYGAKRVGENEIPKDTLNELFHCSSMESSCHPMAMLEHFKQSDTIERPYSLCTEKALRRSINSTLSGHSFYVDADVSADLQHKVVEAVSAQGATLEDQLVVRHKASHVVCEGPSFQKYVGHADNLVTPLWVLKTAKEKRQQRLVHISADLAQQVGAMLSIQSGLSIKDRNEDNALSSGIKLNLDERQKIAKLAKDGVRKRRGYQMQRCQTPIRPVTPNSLLDSICWSVSEPICSASVYMEPSSGENSREHRTDFSFNANGAGKDAHASFVNGSRNITESEKTAVIFKNHFLTILFPVDRFAEMGPCSRTFFSVTGFTCLQLLDYIYAFYQENMSKEEIELAIHTDSTHADRLRSMYSSKETAEHGFMHFKRIEFLGSRRSFEMLKRVAGDNNGNVYELLIRP